MFRPTDINRPFLQNLESGARSANSIQVIWSHIRLTNELKYI
jgi:hypothetical protein